MFDEGQEEHEQEQLAFEVDDNVNTNNGQHNMSGEMCSPMSPEMSSLNEMIDGNDSHSNAAAASAAASAAHNVHHNHNTQQRDNHNHSVLSSVTHGNNNNVNSSNNHAQSTGQTHNAASSSSSSSTSGGGGAAAACAMSNSTVTAQATAALCDLSNVLPTTVIPEMSEVELMQFVTSMQSQLTQFWNKQETEMAHLAISSEQEFKNHNDLPLARIKRIMKSDEDVRMISAEAPVLFAKAAELFILELTIRAWGYSEKCKRRTLQKEDIQAAIQNTDIFDFLVDIIH